MPPPVADRLIFEPSQIIGVEVEAIAAAEFIVIVVEAVDTQPAADVTVTLYVPALTEVASATVGFWTELEKPLGPDQA